jgi:hypothetical protein
MLGTQSSKAPKATGTTSLLTTTRRSAHTIDIGKTALTPASVCSVKLHTSGRTSRSRECTRDFARERRLAEQSQVSENREKQEDSGWGQT